MLNDIRENSYEFINGKIEKKNEMYNFSARCTGKDIGFDENIIDKYFTLNESINVSLKIDGDYIDMFINNKKLFTFIISTEEIIKQFNNLMLDNYVDLSEINWPRRADGSMDYPPPGEDLSRTNDEIISDIETADNIASHESAKTQDSTENNSLPLPLLLAIIGGVAIAAGVAVVVLRKKK